ncbi:GNAT family N-acetyltransferase [Ornithinimicrobium sp. W1665]|uniref:GNAT family N-acetyltransferase n=1 Tax=Ornithinimicrobium sp. W1665 TaxID=3416666 RepID=UPI003D6BF7E0
MSWVWPVVLRTGLPDGSTLVLRPLVRSDREAWEEVRGRNARWLAPWESTVPGRPPGRTSFHRLRRGLDRAARDGYLLPLVLEVGGRLVGQVQLFDVLGGARSSGLVGYWLDEDATGHGYATWAVARLVDHALGPVGLHRVEVAIRPENTASLGVAERLRLPRRGCAAASCTSTVAGPTTAASRSWPRTCGPGGMPTAGWSRCSGATGARTPGHPGRRRRHGTTRLPHVTPETCATLRAPDARSGDGPLAWRTCPA